MLFIILWNVSSKLYNSKYITFGSKSPLFIRKAAFHLFPFLIYTLLQPQIRSNLSKYFTSLSLSMTFSIKDNDVLFFIVYWFSFLQSYISHSNPSFFGIQKYDAVYLELDSTINSALSYSSSYQFNVLSFFIVIVQALVFNSLGVSFVRLISWSYSHLSSSFSNFFLLNRWVNSQVYSRRFSRFVGSSFFSISCCHLSWLSIDCILQFLNNIS